MKKEDYLAKVSIFSYFRKKDLQRLAKRSRYFSFEIGDVIINEEEYDGRFFILINGKVDVTELMGNEIFTYLTNGDHTFVARVDPRRRGDDARRRALFLQRRPRLRPKGGKYPRLP